MVGDNGIYRLYRLYPDGHQKVEQRLIARFAIVGGVVHHLEDHDGILDDTIPEGKLSGWALHRMAQMEHSAYWRLVDENDIDQGHHPDLLDEAEGGDPWEAPAGEPVQETKGQFTLTKREQALEKMAPELAEHLKVLRQAAPESANFLARTMFTDSMVKGVGNKMAYQDFLSRPRQGGVHVLLDGNDFGRINKDWGQSVGDEAIKAMGGAISRASRANRGKLFRVGGDEFRAYFEQPEHAHSFLRHMRKELEALPPVMGQHRHSVSAGIAATPEEAEQALIHAKNAKKAAAYAPGHAETHAHSLLPGAAGPVQVAERPEVPSFERPKAPSPVQGPAFASPLKRSEDPEVQELRMRKFEADLAKMAVIHDGPKPMGVWRVQDDDGRGPYVARAFNSNPFDSNRPTPHDDFESEERPVMKQYGRVKFGFLAPEHAEQWFGPDGMTNLRQRGFTLRQVLARKVWQSKSGRQVMFEPHYG